MSLPVTERRGDVVSGLATTTRLYTLAFSVPYVWLWTAGLAGPQRIGFTGAHAFTLLAFNAWNDAVDTSRGFERRLALNRDPRRTVRPLAGPATLLLAGLALACSLAAASAWSPAPVAVVLVLAAGWAGGHLPTWRKYLLVPELAAPALLLALPAWVLSRFTDAGSDVFTAVAGCAFLIALILATHLRDRDADLAEDVPTVATRRPATTGSWFAFAGTVGAVGAVAPLYHPLGVADVLAILGAAGFGLGMLRPAHRVSVLTAAHACYALSLLLR